MYKSLPILRRREMKVWHFPEQDCNIVMCHFLHLHYTKYQRWSTEAWKRGTFGMFPEYGCPSWHLLSIAPRCSLLIAPELERCSRGTHANCPRREPHFSPPICHISPPTDPICVVFIWVVYILIKNTIATKMGQNGAVVGQVPHFGPFPLEKISKRGGKSVGNQVRLSACQTILHHIRSTPVVFWGEKRPWVECGGSIRKHSVPNFELGFCTDRWGVPFGLKLHKTWNYVT
jgi:hypothetical protein